MENMRDIVKLAVDAHKGTVEKYSVGQSQEALREALIELNGGSTKLDYRAIRDGKCPGLFALIEEILRATIPDDLAGNEFVQSMVDFRNVAEGDENLFLVEDAVLFSVDDIANGTQAIRRQRLAGPQEVVLPTTMKAVRIYEELNRILAGRVDFNHLIDVVAASFNRKIIDDIYTLWMNASAADIGGSTFYPAAGTYDEDTLLDLIAHVEAAADGKPATIIGTKKACRQMQESIQSFSAKEELHNMGYYGKFFGTPVVALPQRHKVGTTNFLLPDDKLTIIAGDEKPIKFVYEGDPLVIMRNPEQNMDLTQEYFYGDKYGLGIVMAGGNAGVGIYET